MRQQAAAGQATTAADLSARRDVDEVDGRLGDVFNVHPQWLRLR